MVDWEYIRVCIAVLSVQVLVIIISSIAIGLIVYVGVAVGSCLLAVCAFVDAMAPPDMSKLLLFFVVLDEIYIVLINLGWIVGALSTFIAILASIIIVLEVIVDEIFAFVHSCDKSPAIGRKEGRWETVAIARSSNNGYGSKQVRGVIVCDRINARNIDFVHVVEIRRHNVLWKEVVVWRVSILSGAQTWVARKQFVAVDSPFNRRFNVDRVRCFESAGVVFVIVRDFLHLRPRNLLFVYDTVLNGKSAHFELPRSIAFENVACVTCLRRTISPNGWRIRVLSIGWHRDWSNQGNAAKRLSKCEMELHDGVVGPTNITETRMYIRSFDYQSPVEILRTSDGMFGVCVHGDSRVLLYDPASNVYVFCADLEELTNLDNPFAAYIKHRGEIVSGYACPTVLNDRECILVSNDGRIVRMEIEPIRSLQETNLPHGSEPQDERRRIQEFHQDRSNNRPFRTVISMRRVISG